MCARRSPSPQVPHVRPCLAHPPSPYPQSNNDTTFSTQGSHIEPLPAEQNPPGVERFLYVGDRYEPYIDTSEGSRYVFLALEVRSDGQVVLFPDQPWGLGDDWPTEGGVALWN